ncbi:MAG: pyridoxamine 5'-phosphate oxidase family protein [Chloroflexia bacterium]|nr:pyridoxamine 5'-phosphate oxidase family protein [Chloroflexia bacterium]
MLYNNSKVRRQNRLLDEVPAIMLLKNGEYGVLSMISKNGDPYGIPINFVWDGQHSIYLHCAPEGRKLDYIRSNNLVSFCVVGKTNVLPDKFSTEYESIILECTALINLASDERMNALMLLIDKYSPNFKDKGMKYAEGSFGRTEIIKLDIISWSGKSKNSTKRIINN